jgi:hypothetical protein
VAAVVVMAVAAAVVTAAAVAVAIAAVVAAAVMVAAAAAAVVTAVRRQARVTAARCATDVPISPVRRLPADLTAAVAAIWASRPPVGETALARAGTATTNLASAASTTINRPDATIASVDTNAGGFLRRFSLRRSYWCYARFFDRRRA